MSAQTLELHKLRAGLTGVLDAIENEHGTTFDLPHDYYWHLHVNAAYEMAAKPTVTMVGRVSDDLEEMESALTEDDEIGPVWHDLGHLIGVLRALEHISLPRRQTP